MRRSTTALVATTALVLGACAAGTSAGTSPPVAAQPNITVNSPDTNQSGIFVSGTGEVTGTPDTVSVDFGVSVLGKTVAKAVEKAAERADALIEALTSNGVEQRDITTTNYSIYPEYDYRGNTERLIGYRVTNTVRAKIRQVSEAGDVIDAAVASAGNDARVSGLRFSIEDDADMVAAAREAAWNDALAKARQLAELSGRTLGPAISITETVSRPPTPIFFEGEEAAFTSLAASTPIEPGSSTVTISLQVLFAFGG
jgi:uncharacterized protein YggE